MMHVKLENDRVIFEAHYLEARPDVEVDGTPADWAAQREIELAGMFPDAGTTRQPEFDGMGFRIELRDQSIAVLKAAYAVVAGWSIQATALWRWGGGR